MPRVSKVERAVKYGKLAAGLRARLPPGQTLVVRGVTYRVEELIDELDGMVAEMRKTDAVHAAYRAQLARERAREGRIHALALGVQAWVASLLGTAPDLVAQFALKVGKPGPRTVAAKAQMVAKAKATRAERGSGGKKRRRRR